MSDNPARTDETITLLKIQALLASAYELSRQAGNAPPRSDTKFLSYLIKMARMEVGPIDNRLGVAIVRHNDDVGCADDQARQRFHPLQGITEGADVGSRPELRVRADRG